MKNVLRLQAVDYRGRPVPCTFQVADDSGARPPMNSTDPMFELAVTQKVTVTATPTSSAGPFWEETFSFSVGADGALTLDVDLRGRRVELITAFVPEFRFTLATIKMSKFRDSTQTAVDLLDKVPTSRTPWNAAKQKREAVNVNLRGALSIQYGGWSPHTWDLSPALEAHSLDPFTPLTSKRELNFGMPPLDVDVDSVVLERKDRPVPPYFAVTWPKKIRPHLKPTPAPLLLFLRQNNYINYYLSGEFLDAKFPEHFDYVYLGLFESLHYAKSPLRFIGAKGVPYQAVRAGVDVVTVCPCYAYSKKPAVEYGDLMDPEETEELLKELQAYMFWKDGVDAPPTSLGKTAVAAFSAGHFLLRNWLMDDGKRKGHFLSNVVRAMYFLDPPRPYNDPETKKRVEFIDDLIEGARKWAPDGTDKRIRLYTQSTDASLRKLMDKPLPAPPYFAQSSDKKRTVSVVTNPTWSNWLVTTIDPLLWKAANRPLSKPVPFQFIHFAIAGTMLTHALAQGDFI